MPYRYATEKASHADFAAGRVLLNRPGATSFPVRLASEVFLRCAAFLEGQGNSGPYAIYDPCCGTGYLLTVLGFLHGARVKALYASDIDAEAVDFARRNLALLTPAGLDARIAQIQAMAAQFGKDSHREALASARRLQALRSTAAGAIHTACFVADAARPPISPYTGQVDMLITDVPYGESAQWKGEGDRGSAVWQLLNAQRPALARPAVAAIVSDKGQSARHDTYRRVARFILGKRQITLLTPLAPMVSAPP